MLDNSAKSIYIVLFVKSKRGYELALNLGQVAAIV
jgi:hypothetical protein